MGGKRMKTIIGSIKNIYTMKHLKRYNESLDTPKRISDDIIDAIDILSNYTKPFDVYVFDCIDKLNNMSQEQLNEFYESVSTNRVESNSNEENFMMDMIKRFNLI
jgi:predicted transcriptional regulator